MIRARLLLLAATALLAGCGGDDDEETTASPPPTTTSAAPTDEVPTTPGQAPTTATDVQGGAEPEGGADTLDCGDARRGEAEGISGVRIPCPAAIAVAEAWLDEVAAGEDPTGEIGVLVTSCKGLGDISRLRVVCTSTADARTEVSFFASPDS